MREIKFQFVVDKKYLTKSYTLEEVMGKPECDILSDMEECSCTLTESCNHCECEPQYECSEITGRREYAGSKDKSGREIYEGDLCKRNGFTGIYEIVWHRGSWQIKNETERAIWHQAFCNGASGAELEVIGNIHENPELLK